jgi:hypothetical protein
MSTRPVPQSLDPLLILGETAYTGALAVGGPIDLKQNDAPAILATLRTVTGTPSAVPGEPPIPGTQAIYLEAISAVVAANASHRAALSDAREFSREAIDLLRHVLGRRWNSAWSAAGFTGGSLAVPTNPEPLLSELRSYFGAHPAHGNAALGITATTLQQQLDAIATTRQNAAAKLAARIAAKVQRDESVKQLRSRLIGLRTELDQLLDPDDERWYQFGFSRPSDGRMPALVSGLALRAGLAGEVQVSWLRSTVASSYRVTWRSGAPNAETVTAGLFADLSVTLTGLPSGQTIAVGVSARNDTGETTPTQKTIVVP